MREWAEEKAGVRCPHESFGDVRQAFIVDLESSIVHRPRPGSLDDPSLRERFELVRMDLPYDLDFEVLSMAVAGEYLLESTVAPDDT